MFRWVVLVFGERHNYYMPAGSRMSEGRYCATWLRENQSFDEEQDEPAKMSYGVLILLLLITAAAVLSIVKALM